MINKIQLTLVNVLREKKGTAYLIGIKVSSNRPLLCRIFFFLLFSTLGGNNSWTEQQRQRVLEPLSGLMSTTSRCCCLLLGVGRVQTRLEIFRVRVEFGSTRSSRVRKSGLEALCKGREIQISKKMTKNRENLVIKMA